MLEDAALLDRALALGRALVTFDDDLLAEAAHRLHTGIAFSGVIYAHQQTISIGQAIRDLELIATAGSIEDVERQIIYLPLWRADAVDPTPDTPTLSIAAARRDRLRLRRAG